MVGRRLLSGANIGRSSVSSAPPVGEIVPEGAPSLRRRFPGVRRRVARLFAPIEFEVYHRADGVEELDAVVGEAAMLLRLFFRMR